MQAQRVKTCNNQYSSRKKWIKWIAALAVVGVLFSTGLYATLYTPNHGMSASRYRVADIGRLNVELRYAEFEFNPFVRLHSGHCSSIEEIDYPTDWLASKGMWKFGSYTIGVSEDKTMFVVGARVSPKEVASDTLDTDIDGAVFGCDCDDPNFCLAGSLLRSSQ